ncbi:SCP2 sterol-binding domain-containing protein [Bacillus solimangrovi]|uniref:SCP2 domain-containing protein n=1 Tax=Bacillus solimangrovi TaxID=1305675 RepID=A0A1E5LDZ3_9BACI|nr:SCP2 sterol-binding domain-containing protein [Bacillus solimangrovi]OEH92280.1 hypothetical protein BFG57_03170 [Bacillus solimangrovi]
MVIDIAINELQQRLLQTNYISSLFFKEPMNICLVIDESNYLYNLKGNLCRRIESADYIDLTIKGDEEVVLEFLSGDTPLLSLIKQGRIHVEGNYRMILRFEAIVFCALEIESDVV